MSTALVTLDPATHDRTRFIGGSDIGAILGISPYRNAVDVWLDKLHPDTRPDSDNPATRRGKRMEPYIFQWAHEDFGFEAVKRNERYADPAVPYFCAEIDAETVIDGEPVNAEAKSVHPYLMRDWGEADTDGLPLAYLAQCQWGMSITGRRLCVVFAMFGDELKRYFVERDDGLIQLMRHEADTFWRSHVLPGLQPEIDPNHPRIFETLARLYPGTNGEAFDATTQHEAWYTTMVEAKEKADMYEGIAKGAKAHLVDQMGDYAQLVFADGQALKRAKRKRKGYEVAATEYWDIRLGKAKETDK